MSTDTLDTPTESALSRLVGRLAALVLLAAVAGVLGGGTLTAVRAFTDSWVAPIHLSPQNDAIIQLRLGLTRQKAELARFEAEVRRIDGDLEAVSAGIERLAQLRHHARESMRWQADVQDQDEQAVAKALEHLRLQREILERLRERQLSLTEKARQDLRAGLTDRTEVERQEQALDTLDVSLVDNQRQLDEAQLRRRQLAQDSHAFRTAFAVGKNARGRKPEVAAGEEHEARLELELIKLEAERRGLQSVRQVAADALAKQRELLDEIQTRPLYRAMTQSTDVGFVPYSQLSGVVPDSRVLACVAGLFFCREVGRVSEVVPGEVVTQDPWGDIARGQYAVLELSDPAAVQEKVLRVRKD